MCFHANIRWAIAKDYKTANYLHYKQDLIKDTTIQVSKLGWLLVSFEAK